MEESLSLSLCLSNKSEAGARVSTVRVLITCHPSQQNASDPQDLGRRRLSPMCSGSKLKVPNPCIWRPEWSILSPGSLRQCWAGSNCQKLLLCCTEVNLPGFTRSLSSANWTTPLTWSARQGPSHPPQSSDQRVVLTAKN